MYIHSTLDGLWADVIKDCSCHSRHLLHNGNVSLSLDTSMPKVCENNAGEDGRSKDKVIDIEGISPHATVSPTSHQCKFLFKMPLTARPANCNFRSFYICPAQWSQSTRCGHLAQTHA